MVGVWGRPKSEHWFALYVDVEVLGLEALFVVVVGENDIAGGEGELLLF